MALTGREEASKSRGVWTQLLSLSDIELATSAAEPTAGVAGLPWSAADSWPLSERQLKLLSFELLVLCSAEEDEPQPQPGAGPPTAA